MPAAPLTPDDLLTIPTFQNLPPETLAWLLEHGERRELPDGDTVVQPGDAAEYMMAVLQGSIQFYSVQNGTREPRFRHDPAYSVPPLPTLAVASELSGFDDAIIHSAMTELLRGQNRYVAAMRMALREVHLATTA